MKKKQQTTKEIKARVKKFVNESDIEFFAKFNDDDGKENSSVFVCVHPNTQTKLVLVTFADDTVNDVDPLRVISDLGIGRGTLVYKGNE